MAPRAIIIDTDPGQDDAVAILTALASPDELEVLGVTAVAGNVPLPFTVANARKVLELAGRTDVRVFAGAAGPLVLPLATAEHVHGRTGLDGHLLPEPTMRVEDGHAADFIVETVMARPAGTVTICALGPLTNLALALAREPKIATRLAEIVLMGGAMSEGGNITPAAEFNIYVDPHAAARVFACGAPIVAMPLDVTHKAQVTTPRIARFRGLGNRVGAVLADLLSFSKRFDEAKYGTDGGPLHDPTTVCYLIRPELFAGRTVNVEVETGSRLTSGMTVIDWWGVTDRPKNALVIRDVDDEGYFDLILDRFARLP
jgi:purine nucleosidase